MGDTSLHISEIFHSIQGESTRIGMPCTFIRLAGCHLRCHYCDTSYAFTGGESMSLDRIVARVDAFTTKLVEVTGGEPLLQTGVHDLMTRLCDAGYTVLLETSGACDISPCDQRVVRIVDLKTPGSGEQDRNDWSNIPRLSRRDEVKFVICDRADYEWAAQVMARYNLAESVAAVLMSPAATAPGDRYVRGVTGLAIRDLAEWILADRLPVRLQTQLHKLIWDPQARGV